MAQSMVPRGIPIDGVRLQMNITSTADNGRSTAAIAQNIRRLAGLGLQVHLTDLDVTLCGSGPDARWRSVAPSTEIRRD